jgi:hypothetical protein
MITSNHQPPQALCQTTMSDHGDFVRLVMRCPRSKMYFADMHLSPYESEIITIIVGTGGGAGTFHLHKDVACNASAFVIGCLATEYFPEGRMKTILLLEDNPTDFRVVLAYIYAYNSSKGPALPRLPTYTYIMAYILADKLLMPEVCSMMMHDIVIHHNTRDVFSGVLGGLTAFDLPEYLATRFLIEELAWEFSKMGYDWFCRCEVDGEVDSDACSWCQFFMNGG